MPHEQNERKLSEKLQFYLESYTIIHQIYKYCSKVSNYICEDVVNILGVLAICNHIAYK